jgi:chromosome partitioning protein
MPRVIAVTNQKGGVGKTTTVLNLGAALADLGRRVLCVDIDPQANCTTGLGVRPESLPQSVYDLLVQPRKFSVTRAEDVVVRTAWPRLDLLPSHVNLAGAELQIANRLGREALLRKSLLALSALYDYVLIDTPPSLSLLTVNALVAASEVLVVVRPEPWSLDGVDNLLDTIDAIRQELNPTLVITGVVATGVDSRVMLAREILIRLDRNPRLTGLLLRSTVRRNVALAEASGAGVPVLVHAPRSHGAEAYRALARELMALAGELPHDEMPLIPIESWEEAEEGAGESIAAMRVAAGADASGATRIAAHADMHRGSPSQPAA